MDQTSELCTKCGKPKVGTKGATITQWVSLCQCDSLLKSSPEDGEKVEWCQTCGKKVESKRHGSMTQWIFRENSCRCDFPQITESSAVNEPLQVSARPIEKSPTTSGIRLNLEGVIEQQSKERSSALGKTIAIVGVFVGVLTIASIVFVMMNEKKTASPPIKSTLSSLTPIEMELAERPPAEVFGTIGLITDGTTVVKVNRFTPSETVGIATGDKIISIDKQNVNGKTTEEIAQKLSGSCGDRVELLIDRDGKQLVFLPERTEDIHEAVPDNLTPGQYLKLGIEEKFAGNFNRSRLALTLAKERGDGRVKEQAAQQMRSELPKEYVSFEAQKLNSEAHNLLIAAAYKSFLVQAKECIEKYPNFEPPYISLAQFYLLDDKADKALELLDKVSRINPDFSDAWILRSIVADSTGDRLASKQSMEKHG